ncbi:CS1-pili formation C-terminal domain-containing protein [Enterobacter cloacae]|uniref:CS1-pili formation C-terminal domain-containing protein n=1 Tax=Enterobacter cloacae TaxID=550 RepID=UPI001B816D7A|nr:CS1-pili formation C-terminal domain-containing protein [Enterobacter cloacae]MCM2486858.1 CS1-pili formation C-terminal domain-containing protein [Enterobacter cloacae]UWA65685.1 CS1-pili formation C-terminal domain-containing protein [Enterobacter cloacae]HBC2537864.1 CS1-pili formation C-terminal domain-containing protein [Enterobacter cloacae]HBC2545730.1 CS1-pili formation C-terminal domain-containing protein [Enterobacter cloacae]HDC4271511.1 CS1-pili formation C-terminal domain-conta
MVKNKLVLPVMMACTSGLLPAYAHAASSSVVIANYRFPDSLYALLEQGIKIPVYLVNTRPGAAQQAGSTGDVSEYVRIGDVTIYAENRQLGLRDVQVQESDNGIRLSKEMRTLLQSINGKQFDDHMRIPVSAGSAFELDQKKMRLLLNLSQRDYGVNIRPREVDIDAPESDDLSGTLSYNLGAYHTESGYGDSWSSGYLNAKSWVSMGVDHLLVDGSGYVNENSSDTQMNAVMWERDYQGMRYAAGMLNGWAMQSLASVSGISGGEVYGVSVGNQANSRKRDNTLSLTPIVVYFPTAGEARIRRDGQLIGIQRFDVGNHEIDTSALPYGIYSVEVEVVSGSRTVSRSMYTVNKPFTNNVSESLRWQTWGGIYSRDKSVVNYKKYAKRKNEQDNSYYYDYDTKHKDTMSLVGASFSKRSGMVDWNASGYMMREHVVSELWASLNLTGYFSVNTQTMAASDGTYRANYGANVSLPWNIGSVWYSHEQLSSGKFLDIYENKGNTWGASFSLPSFGLPSAGNLSLMRQEDDVYRYKRYQVDYSQGLYAGRYGTARLRVGMSRNKYEGYYEEKDRYVMLDFSIPLGNTVSVGVSHNRDTGTALNVSASRQFEGDYLKSVTANVSRAFSSNQDRTVSGGGSVSFDTPWNSNILSVQSGTSKGWNSTLTSDGSVGWSKEAVAAGKGTHSAGVIVSTGLKSDESLTLKLNGRTERIKGDKTWLSLPAYQAYDLEVMNSETGTESYDIGANARRHITVYPGNTVVMKPQVKKIVTLFGRLVDANGNPVSATQIKNHVGLTRTENDGRFVIDVDKNNPVLSIATPDDSVCEVRLDIASNRGALWLGDISCDKGDFVWQEAKGTRERDDEKDIRS